MAFGIAVNGAKSYDMKQSRPLSWVGSVPINIQLGQNNVTSGDFSGACPAGTQLVCIPDNALALLGTPVATTIQYKPVQISINDRTVTVSLDLNTNLQSPNFQGGAGNRPSVVNVYAVYPGGVQRGQWGFAVQVGGTFPLVVDSSKGLFLTYRYNGSFNGNLSVPVGSQSQVFVYWDNPNVGIYYDAPNQTLRGYISGNNQGGINIPIKVCAFQLKTPAVPAYGIAIRGADGGVSFTSAETPMIMRGLINTPGGAGQATGFGGTDINNQPMIPVMKLGGQLASKNWYHLIPGRSGGSFFCRPGPFINGGDSNNTDQQVCAYSSKPLPYLWSSDYF